jgi:hypothetical protein
MVYNTSQTVDGASHTGGDGKKSERKVEPSGHLTVKKKVLYKQQCRRDEV